MENTANNIVEIETEKRTALAYNSQFIKTSIKLAKKLGISAEEWNKNKAFILMTFAHEAVKMMQDNGLDTFGIVNEKLTILG
jgi:hypothetical protein